MSIITYQKNHTICFRLPKYDSSVISIVNNIVEMPLTLSGQIISNNLFVNNLQAYAKISSLPLAEMPNFDLEDSETDKLYKALNVEWNSPRKQLDLFISKGQSDWFHVGSLSLLNPSGYPYRTYNLQDLYTDSLAIELGNEGRIGVAVKNVGYNLLEDDDIVSIFGSAVQEIVVNTDSSNDLGKILDSNSVEVLVGTNNTLALAANPLRKYLLIQNKSNNNIFINFDNVTINTGFKLKPDGHFEMSTLLIPYYGNFYAISESEENAKLFILEGI